MDGGNNARTCWTEETTAYFIQLIQEQVRKCPRGNIFILTEIYGVHYQTSILKNRFNSLKRKYNDITTLLNNGFQWDRAKHLVVADDDNAHPNARSYRTNNTLLYDDLCLIYGGSPVDDKLNDTGEEEMDDDFSVEILGENPATNKDTADGIENCSHDEEEAVRQEEENDDIENLEEGSFKIKNEDLLSIQGGSTNEGSSKVSVYRSRVTWITSMDRDFIFLMKNHVLQGNKTKRTFEREAWTHMILLCRKNDLFTDLMQLVYHSWLVTMILFGSNAWLVAYPHSKQYRVSPVPFYKYLCIIFGDTYITGRNNNLGGDPVHNLQEDSSLLGIYYNKRILKSPLDSGHSEKLKNTDQSVIDVSHEMGSAKLGVVCF
ncbi:hypothetical protein MKW92_020053 [Papaver armeniacum]|nr:hypothetical protein MKW92_020053 [Papaver armeniacum]